MDIKNLGLLQMHGPKSSMDLVVDLRKMTNNKKGGGQPQLSTLVHPECGWSNGHMLHVFNDKKCVLSLVLALSGAALLGPNEAGGGGAKRMLEPVQMTQCMDVEYAVATAAAAPSQQPEDEQSQLLMAPPKQPKKKVKTTPSPGGPEAI
jgi:hypothetical protein